MHHFLLSIRRQYQLTVLNKLHTGSGVNTPYPAWLEKGLLQKDCSSTQPGVKAKVCYSAS